MGQEPGSADVGWLATAADQLLPEKGQAKSGYGKVGSIALWQGRFLAHFSRSLRAMASRKDRRCAPGRGRASLPPRRTFCGLEAELTTL
jgi:hypothetical protein